MYQGFYDLASGMLTQRRNLNNISNNMSNIQTAGYKKDTMVSQSFSEQMLIRTGRYNKENPEDLAITSKINSANRTYTDYEQGAFDITDGALDFAISGNGFFQIQTTNGVQYTRNGSFALSEEGVLEIPGIGSVLDENGNTIRLTDENFTVDEQGNIIGNGVIVLDANGEVPDTDDVASSVSVAKIGIVDFADYEALHKEDNGMFSTNQQAMEVSGETQIFWKMLEKSNVDMVSEMTTMMSSQRALQSAAQMLKMYDSVMSKASTDVGRL